MVSRLIKNENIRTAEHHFAKHTSYTLAARKNIRHFERFVAGKQHSAEPRTNIGFKLLLTVLTKPVNKTEIYAVKILAVVRREIALRRCNAPLIASLVGLQLAHNNLEKRCLCNNVASYKSNLFSRVNNKADIVKHLSVADSLCKVVNTKKIVSAFPVGLKVNIRKTA